MTKFIVLDPNEIAIAVNVDLFDAADAALTYDSRSHEIRTAANGESALWTKEISGEWTATVATSREADAEAAKRDIYSQVIAAGWDDIGVFEMDHYKTLIAEARENGEGDIADAMAEQLAE